MAAKPGNNFISGTLTDSVIKFGIFDDDDLDKSFSQMIATTIDYQRLQDWRQKRLYCHFRLSVDVAISRGQFRRAGRGRTPQICCWNCHPICRSSRDISISGFGGHTVISGYRSLSQSLGDTLFGLAMVENLGAPLEFRHYLL